MLNENDESRWVLHFLTHNRIHVIIDLFFNELSGFNYTLICNFDKIYSLV